MYPLVHVGGMSILATCLAWAAASEVRYIFLPGALDRRAVVDSLPEVRNAGCATTSHVGDYREATLLARIVFHVGFAPQLRFPHDDWAPFLIMTFQIHQREFVVETVSASSIVH